jgi:hypothetical protein
MHVANLGIVPALHARMGFQDLQTCEREWRGKLAAMEAEHSRQLENVQAVHIAERGAMERQHIDDLQTASARHEEELHAQTTAVGVAPCYYVDYYSYCYYGSWYCYCYCFGCPTILVVYCSIVLVLSLVLPACLSVHSYYYCCYPYDHYYLDRDGHLQAEEALQRSLTEKDKQHHVHIIRGEQEHAADLERKLAQAAQLHQEVAAADLVSHRLKLEAQHIEATQRSQEAHAVAIGELRQQHNATLERLQSQHSTAETGHMRELETKEALMGNLTRKV